MAIIIAAAAPFAWTLTVEQVPQKVAAALGGLGVEPAAAAALINGFLLVVGLFMEMIAAMVILVPILVPMIKAAGIDTVHFGIVLVLNLVIGALTPPHGHAGVHHRARRRRAGDATCFARSCRSCGALLLVLMVVTYVPALTIGVVRWLGP